MNSCRRAARYGLMAALIAAALPQCLSAQTVRGTVTDSASRQPIPGAVVTLLDVGGRVLDRNITDERGQYRMSYRGSAHSLRVVRIGFQPLDLSLSAATGAERSLDVTMVPFTTTLAAVRITGKRDNCPGRADATTALSFWDQARAGLLNSIVARKSTPMSVHRLYFSRALSGDGAGIKSFVVSEDFSESAKTSFTAARSASDLVRRGFAGDTGVVVGYMFGPDADTFVDDAFARGYCFRIAEPDQARPHQVGVAFSPANFSKGRVDIDGVLWIDTVARALRDVEFRYVGMHPTAEQFHPGGTMSFATGENGVAFIDRWSLRLVGNAPSPIYPKCRWACGTRDSYFPIENGAEVSHVAWRDGRRWDARLGTVSIRATTAAGRVSAGTVVELAGTHYRAMSDSTGTAQIKDLLPGPYIVFVVDRRVNGLGISLRTPVSFVAVRDSVVQLSLEVPSVEDFVVSACRKDRQWKTTDSTYLFGRLVDADKQPVAEARVTFAVQKNKGDWDWSKETLKTDADGLFESCGATLPAGSKLRLHVESDRSWPRDLMRDGRRDPAHDVMRDITDRTTIVPLRIDVRP